MKVLYLISILQENSNWSFFSFLFQTRFWKWRKMKSLPVFKISFADIQGWDRVNFAGLKGTVSPDLNDMTVVPRDQITIKTPNTKCRIYWCLIEFIGWRYNQSCWYFRPLLWVSKGIFIYTVYNRGEGASDRKTTAAKPLHRSIFRKRRHLGYGVFIAIWSMVVPLDRPCLGRAAGCFKKFCLYFIIT